jgi:hypothetical protein
MQALTHQISNKTINRTREVVRNRARPCAVFEETALAGSKTGVHVG